jgi:hypothetical protein
MAFMVSQFPGETWEIFNEPDGDVFFLPGGKVVAGNYDTVESTLAAAYVPLVQAAYKAMKAADPSCTVIAGVLGSQPINTKFTNYCYANGMAGNYDAFSFHPYHNYPTPYPDSTYNPIDYFGPLIDALQATRAAASDKTPLWITEFGWAAYPTKYSTDSAPAVVPAATQAGWMANFIQGLANRGDIDTAISYEFMDDRATPSQTNTDSGNFYGVVDYELNPKPAYTATSGVLSSLK